MEVETLTVACKEKDKKFQELQQTLVKFKRVSACLNHKLFYEIMQLQTHFDSLSSVGIVSGGDWPLHNLSMSHHQSQVRSPFNAIWVF